MTTPPKKIRPWKRTARKMTMIRANHRRRHHRRRRALPEAHDRRRGHAQGHVRAHVIGSVAVAVGQGNRAGLGVCVTTGSGASPGQRSLSLPVCSCSLVVVPSGARGGSVTLLYTSFFISYDYRIYDTIRTEMAKTLLMRTRQ